MFGLNKWAVAATVGLLAFGVSGNVGAAGAGARAKVNCSISGTIMTVTVNAKTSGGGKPAQIGSAGPVIIVLQEKVGTQYSTASGFKMSMAQTGLPATATFDMCNSIGSLINPDSRSVRGRGSVFVPNVGFVSGVCSPSKVPSCGS